MGYSVIERWITEKTKVWQVRRAGKFVAQEGNEETAQKLCEFLNSSKIHTTQQWESHPWKVRARFTQTAGTGPLFN